MKTKALILALLFLVCCEKEKKIPTCPACSEEVGWEGDEGGRYGEWITGEAGYDGWDDTGTLNLKRDCEWKILGNNVGGYGKEYIIYSCDTSVVFGWAYGIFCSITVQEGWTGSTKEGIRIGDDLTKFLKAYPYFQPYNPYYGLDSTIFVDDQFPNTNVWASFLNNKLIKLEIF